MSVGSSTKVAIQTMHWCFCFQSHRICKLFVDQGLCTGSVENCVSYSFAKKKNGNDFDFKNYRPVSNLPFISKIVEKAVVDQLLRHCEENTLLPDCQSGYRRFSSTETALLKVQNDILLNMDKQEVTFLVLLDLGAAFDTIDHSTT